MVFEKGEVFFVDKKDESIEGYILKDFPIFGIIKYKKTDKRARKEWAWCIVHIPSEAIFSDIFITQKSAKIWLKLFLEQTSDSKKILLTMPGIDLVRNDFSKEINKAFCKWAIDRREEKECGNEFENN